MRKVIFIVLITILIAILEINVKGNSENLESLEGKDLSKIPNSAEIIKKELKLSCDLDFSKGSGIYFKTIGNKHYLMGKPSKVFIDNFKSTSVKSISYFLLEGKQGINLKTEKSFFIFKNSNPNYLLSKIDYDNTSGDILVIIAKKIDGEFEKKYTLVISGSGMLDPPELGLDPGAIARLYDYKTNKEINYFKSEKITVFFYLDGRFPSQKKNKAIFSKDVVLFQNKKIKKDFLRANIPKNYEGTFKNKKDEFKIKKGKIYYRTDSFFENLGDEHTSIKQDKKTIIFDNTGITEVKEKRNPDLCSYYFPGYSCIIISGGITGSPIGLREPFCVYGKACNNENCCEEPKYCCKTEKDNYYEKISEIVFDYDIEKERKKILSGMEEKIARAKRVLKRVPSGYCGRAVGELMKEFLGFDLPRPRHAWRLASIYGGNIKKPEKLGDLIFVDFDGGRFDHVVFYLGNGLCAHKARKIPNRVEPCENIIARARRVEYGRPYEYA